MYTLAYILDMILSTIEDHFPYIAGLGILVIFSCVSILLGVVLA